MSELDRIEPGSAHMGVAPAADFVDCPECGDAGCEYCDGRGYVAAPGFDDELEGDELAAYIATFPAVHDYLVATGAPYASEIGDGWYEVDSGSDGMSGWIACENPWTTAHVKYHWTVHSKTCTSQHAAREAARKDLVAHGASR